MFETSLTFGRGPGADVVLPGDDYMSPVHCEVFQLNGRWYVTDLGSTNGTWIRRGDHPPMKAIGSALLEPGDKVRIGRTDLPWEVDR